MPLHITARTGDSIKFIHAKQLALETELYPLLKKILKISETIKFYKKNKKPYTMPKSYGIDKSQTSMLYSKLLDKLNEYKNVPTLGSKIEEILSTQSSFDLLELNDQCEFIAQILNIFACNAVSSNLSVLLDKSTEVAGKSIRGTSIINRNISYKLIHQSITGLITKEIDLNEI